MVVALVRPVTPAVPHGHPVHGAVGGSGEGGGQFEAISPVGVGESDGEIVDGVNKNRTGGLQTDDHMQTAQHDEARSAVLVGGCRGAPEEKSVLHKVGGDHLTGQWNGESRAEIDVHGDGTKTLAVDGLVKVDVRDIRRYHRLALHVRAVAVGDVSSTTATGGVRQLPRLLPIAARAVESPKGHRLSQFHSQRVGVKRQGRLAAQVDHIAVGVFRHQCDDAERLQHPGLALFILESELPRSGVESVSFSRVGECQVNVDVARHRVPVLVLEGVRWNRDRDGGRQTGTGSDIKVSACARVNDIWGRPGCECNVDKYFGDARHDLDGDLSRHVVSGSHLEGDPSGLRCGLERELSRIAVVLTSFVDDEDGDWDAASRGFPGHGHHVVVGAFGAATCQHLVDIVVEPGTLDVQLTGAARDAAQVGVVGVRLRRARLVPAPTDVERRDTGTVDGESACRR